jgi:4-hydroxythreonine-4-phosphate dehydrogenase
MARRIAVTCGDPAGIGPEVVLKALSDSEVPATVYGPVDLFRRLGAELDLPVPEIVPCGEGNSWKPSTESGRVALAAIDRAIESLLRGDAGGLVTAPVSKEWIHRSGTPFTGHTEYLAARAGIRSTTMMFVADRLKVSLVTRHVPLRDVPARITLEGIATTIRHTDSAMREFFRIGSPRIAVAGLNPHAGEGGLVGREEKDVIAPAIEVIRAEGIACEGPLAGDSVFRSALAGDFDAVVAMYHDQGLAAVKSVAPGAVNLTLGLPFIRTSPDHGTAFDVAGKGRADAAGLRAALDMASQLASRKAPLA